MALTSVTVTVDLHQLLGGDFDARRTRAYVKTNVANGTLMDTSTGEIRLGDQKVTIGDDGTGSFTTWAPGPDGNPVSWQTSLVVEYPRTGQRDRAVRTFGPYTITASADLADLEEEQAVPAEYLTQVTDELQTYSDAAAASASAAQTARTGAEAARDEAQALVLSDLGTTDGQTRALIENPASQTASALSASYDRIRPLDTRSFGALHDGTTDDTAAIQAALNAAGSGLTATNKVELPPLPARITGTLTIPSGVELAGTGAKASVLKQTAGDVTSIRTQGGEGQAIRNLRLENFVTGARTVYDIEICNPFHPVLEHVEVALSQTATLKGGIRFYKDAGVSGSDTCFMPMLIDVWVRNGVLKVEQVTDGHMIGGWVWGTYTGAPGAIELSTSSSNWNFTDVDVVPALAGYAITGSGLSNLTITGGLMDGPFANDGVGFKVSSGAFVRGLVIQGVKFLNCYREAILLDNVRRACITGNVFSENNRRDQSHADIKLTNGSSNNVIVGNTFGAPTARTNKGRIYEEDATSTDNVFASNAMEASPSNYASTLLSVNRATVTRNNVPGTASWGITTPSIVVPPLSTLLTLSATAWPTANLAIFQRFTIPEGCTQRYFNMRLDGSSGNYQVGVVRLSGSGLTTYTRVMNSGVIAAPAAGDLRIDLGATPLGPGDYALFVWFDNTTATARVASNSGVSSMRLAAEVSGLTTGVPSTGTLAWNSTRILGGVNLEADI